MANSFLIAAKRRSYSDAAQIGVIAKIATLATLIANGATPKPARLSSLLALSAFASHFQLLIALFL
ncbi:MAG: hypothetical protein LBF86_09470 [Helicobacteraceae bacterium]|jgi:hypothetical protein|nr:hypothetical protein [Helicobacteraceae bacterium]